MMEHHLGEPLWSAIDFEDARCDDRMTLHLQPLIQRERAVLVEDGIADPCLAQIMRQPSQRKISRCASRPAERARQPVGIDRYAAAVVVCEPVALFDAAR